MSYRYRVRVVWPSSVILTVNTFHSFHFEERDQRGAKGNSIIATIGSDED